MVKNSILKAHRQMLVEARKTPSRFRRVRYLKIGSDEILEKSFLPTEPISMAEYCPVPRPLNIQDMIVEAVRKEDLIRSTFEHTPKEIPKMSYPEIKFRPASLKAFIRSFAP